MRNSPRILIVALILTLAAGAQAAQWSSTSASLLAGDGYELASETSATILTLEHANGWEYGDNFFFFDVFQPTGDGTGVYGEWHPRLSFGKMTGNSFAFGPVKDVLIASEINTGDGVRIRMAGLGFDLDLPHFAFFSVNVFVRDDTAIADETSIQISPSWNLPFSIGELRFEFGGFLDYVTEEGAASSHLLTQPQLLLDVGHLFDETGRLYVGTEYQYWKNKYGVDGVDDSFAQFMVKWLF